MNIHKIQPANRVDYTMKTIDINGRVPGTDTIEFLRVERPYRHGRKFGPLVRVR